MRHRVQGVTWPFLVSIAPSMSGFDVTWPFGFCGSFVALSMGEVSPWLRMFMWFLRTQGFPAGLLMPRLLVRAGGVAPQLPWGAVLFCPCACLWWVIKRPPLLMWLWCRCGGCAILILSYRDSSWLEFFTGLFVAWISMARFALARQRWCLSNSLAGGNVTKQAPPSAAT